MLVDDALAIGASQDRLTRHGDPAPLLGGRGEDSDELPGAQTARVAANGELYRHSLVAIGQTRTDIGQINRAAADEKGLRRAVRRLRFEAQGFDPELRGIDDLEDDRVGLGHLAGDSIRRGDDAIHRCQKWLRFAIDTVEICTSRLQSFEFQLGILELASGDHLLDDGEALDLARHDRNLLIELTRLLLLDGCVGRGQRRTDVGQDVTGLDGSAERFETTRRWAQTTTNRGLNQAAGVRVWDGAARQLKGPAMRQLLSRDGAQGQNALRRLWHK